MEIQAMDYYMKFENLNDEYKLICEKLNIEYKSLKKLEHFLLKRKTKSIGNI